MKVLWEFFFLMQFLKDQINFKEIILLILDHSEIMIIKKTNHHFLVFIIHINIK